MEKEKRLSKGRLALVTIVKNEAHCVTRMLSSALPYVDYIVINDTGSTDNTIKAITSFCEGCRVPFVIITQEEWNGFADARNRALSYMPENFDSEWWVLQLDADEVLHVNKFPELSADIHAIYISNIHEMALGARIFRNGLKYEGEIHEHIVKANSLKAESHHNIYIEHIHDGARSKTSRIVDIEVLNDLYVKTNELRYLFYVGETLMSQGLYLEAFNSFVKRAMKQTVIGFDEERYLSFMRAAKCALEMNDIPLALCWFLEAWRFCQRCEPAYYAMCIFNHNQAYYMACELGRSVMEIEHKGIIIEPEIWDWKFYWEYFIASKSLTSPQTTQRLAKLLLGSNAPSPIKREAGRFV